MKKIILTEADKKQIVSAKEKAIMESFAKTFNKIKRLDENELNENGYRPIAIGDVIEFPNGKIYKIGQSADGNGINGCMGFYLSAGQDSSGPNRFAINYLVRECMKNGDKIEIYMKYKAPKLEEVEGLFSEEKEWIEVAPSAKDMEQLAMKQFKRIENEYPLWNFQERGVIIPNEIQKIFENYKSNRNKK